MLLPNHLLPLLQNYDMRIFELLAPTTTTVMTMLCHHCDQFLHHPVGKLVGKDKSHQATSLDMVHRKVVVMMIHVQAHFLPRSNHWVEKFHQLHLLAEILNWAAFLSMAHQRVTTIGLPLFLRLPKHRGDKVQQLQLLPKTLNWTAFLNMVHRRAAMMNHV